MNKDLNFNERLRRNMKEKGPEAAKKWNDSLQEAANKQTTVENKKSLKNSVDE